MKPRRKLIVRSGTVNLDMRPREMSLAALEFARTGDQIGLQHLLNDARARAAGSSTPVRLRMSSRALLDSIICLAAIFLEYEQWDWFERVIELLREIYSMPLGPDDAQRFGYSTRIPPNEPAPSVWLQLMTRLYALGALAVRRRQWRAVRTLTMQLPDRLMGYETNWLRHAITMMSRAQHLQGQQGGRTVELNLLSLAEAQAARLECLRPDGLDADADELLTSLAQFDILTNIVAVEDSPELAYGKTFYPNFARLQPRPRPRTRGRAPDATTGCAPRSGPRTMRDSRRRFAPSRASPIHEGMRYHGFRNWEHTPAGRVHRRASAGRRLSAAIEPSWTATTLQRCPAVAFSVVRRPTAKNMSGRTGLHQCSQERDLSHTSSR